MDLIVLSVPDCPHLKVLEERLAQVIEGRDDLSVSRQVVVDQEEAASGGMHGSPTILVDGTDPFATPGQLASVSCRLYRDSDGHLDGAPSVSQLRQAIEDAASKAGSTAWLDALGRGGRDQSQLDEAAAPSDAGGIVTQSRALAVGEQIFGQLLQ